ncbi:MAG: Sapep family Mn(2+)-dependent dipeptidase [Eubacterium sp.]|nr:Sapep family Mn(2+)-dependent dipeptidase [Eubacterium sp.]
MTEQLSKEIKERVEGYRELLLERLGELVAIPSTEGKPESDAPFGREPKRALEAALKMCEADGFRTKNVDNYAGYAEMGEGEQLIGVIGHLDVVPAAEGDGWDSDPFTMTERDGVLYGRGVADDKGAVVASMISMKVLKDMGIPLTKRVRLIMGTNEETGSRCLEYYVQKEGHVDYGFTPDGDFPLVYGEKGMIRAKYEANTQILSIEGGAASNIVCGKVKAAFVPGTLPEEKLASYFGKNGIRFELTKSGDADSLTVFGKTAHASTPELGVNAIAYLFAGLKDVGFADPLVDFYCGHIGTATDGNGLFGEVRDEYGALTLNTGVIKGKNGAAEGTIDIRFPVTMSAEQILALAEGKLSDANGQITITGTTEPLFFSPESDLVKSLAESYVEVTGDTVNKPMTIGGGTYAKEIHNTVAFGCAFPGIDYHLHDNNEWVRIDELLLQAEIYVHGILKLLEV